MFIGVFAGTFKASLPEGALQNNCEQTDKSKFISRGIIFPFLHTIMAEAIC